MTNPIVKASDESRMLPGLVPPDAQSDALIDKFFSEIEGMGIRQALPKLPTPDERRMLVERRDNLFRLVRPISAAGADRDRAARAIALMLAGFPSLRNADAVGMCGAYLTHLEDLPLFAVQAGCEDAIKRRIYDIDKNGRHIKLDPDFPPSSARIYDQASKHAERARALMHGVNSVLAVKLESPRADPAVREAIGAKMAALAASLTLRRDDERSERRKAATAAAAKRGADATAISRQAIEAEYGAIGVEPLRSGEMLVSPALAAQIQGGKRVKARRGKST